MVNMKFSIDFVDSVFITFVMATKLLNYERNSWLFCRIIELIMVGTLIRVLSNNPLAITSLEHGHESEEEKESSIITSSQNC